MRLVLLIQMSYGCPCMPLRWNNYSFLSFDSAESIGVLWLGLDLFKLRSFVGLKTCETVFAATIRLIKRVA